MAIRRLATQCVSRLTTSSRLHQPMQQQRCFFMFSASRLGSFKYRHTRTIPEDAVNPLATPTKIDAGTLHIVSVPIGNLKDFSIRALDVLQQVDYIVTTDRPATKTLLDLVHIEAQGRLIHYSRSNRTASKDKLVELLRGGRSMALVCTSGTPCVGDVGSELIREMQSEGVRVSAVPGPCALMCALAVSGVTFSPYESDTPLSTSTSISTSTHAKLSSLTSLHSLRDGSFFFGNMLPESHGARLRILRNVVREANHPCVFYEIPRRLLPVLQDVALVLPRRRVVVAHELTKMNESLHADTADKLLAFYSRQEAYMMLKKGQLVLIIDGPDASETLEHLRREAEKRRRLRRSIAELVGEGRDGGDSGKQVVKPKIQSRRKLLRRKRCQRLIMKIEKEQEKIRMAMKINHTDASKL
ncbi:16S rRNA (cytidine1402-2-O)-methyltransferase [Trypanosoma rangeli]|uniref:16S rRNA (Cytidine1402-2-O)-methyltransferase n=1 Tax=Trypanosoma rangeli TaxID=5698 RepID=A0A3R7N6Y9_TRYRA|nr:16S rRNA (cytidine1402-2-O)-methyltransferase [Trypanosoma rangeli]RNF01297.1 16S rRNA (cytidine1402-2-O)-methyltransferase [Trypanosoma rangeli]|eukprot:RNF01297.1 16S rRNA (cytidine1402-2-O)-methyltransferase [Trypanosoma rangeli]